MRLQGCQELPRPLRLVTVENSQRSEGVRFIKLLTLSAIHLSNVASTFRKLMQFVHQTTSAFAIFALELSSIARNDKNTRQQNYIASHVARIRNGYKNKKKKNRIRYS